MINENLRLSLMERKPLHKKWVFKITHKPDRMVDKFKERIVAKGYNQVEGIDYMENFSPVAKLVTIRMFLTIATGFGWPIHQVDVNNTFLHGYIKEDLYLLPPEGYNKAASGQVCKLIKSLYGLK